MNRSESKYFHTAERMDEALLSLLLEKDFAYITVKDVCARAGVNRSTFYLHYENTADLLEEAVDMVHRRYRNRFSSPGPAGDAIAALPKQDLFFITDQWLLPWLTFVKENRWIYKAIHAQLDVFGVESKHRDYFQAIFSPVLAQYGVAAKKRISGIPARRRDKRPFWAAMGAAAGFAATILFAAYNTGLGVRYASLWHGSISQHLLRLVAISSAGILLLIFVVSAVWFARSLKISASQKTGRTTR